ncbi:MAG: hypothetical protein ABIH86_05045 [Planctomycetota bacterium]
MSDLKDKADEPKRVTVDGRSVEQHSLAEQIELDRYLASKEALKKRAGVIRQKMVSPGARGE